MGIRLARRFPSGGVILKAAVLVFISVLLTSAPSLAQQQSGVQVGSALTPILTLLGSGAVAAAVSYYLNTFKEHVLFMSKKGEDLYLSVDRFDRAMGGHFLAAYPLLEGKITFNDYLDAQMKDLSDRDVADASLQVEMLINLYFPSVQPAYNSYLEQRDKLNAVIGQFKRAYVAGKDGSSLFESFHTSMIGLDAKSKELKRVVIAEGRKFAKTNRFWPWRSAVA